MSTARILNRLQQGPRRVVRNMWGLNVVGATPLPDSLTLRIERLLHHHRVRSCARRLGLGQALRVGGVLRRAPHGIRFRVQPADTVEVHLAGLISRFRVASAHEMATIATFGGEKHLLRHLVHAARAGDVVFDIGAHVGLYSVFLAQAVGHRGRVILFEPEPTARRRLLENLRLNDVTNATIFDCALGAEQRDAVFVPEPCLGSGTTSLLTPLPNPPGRLTAVRMVEGDRFIAEQQLTSPTIVKVDVEGMEQEVLSGMANALSRPDCRLVLCEVHFSILARRGCPGRPQELETLLGSLGFCQVRWVDRSHLLASKD